MITLDSTQQATVTAGARGAAWLIDLDFSTGVQRVTDWPVGVTTTGGLTYTGLGGIISVSAIGESEDTDASLLKLSVSIVDSAMLAAAIGPATVWRDRSVAISLQLIDASGRASGAPVPRWSGRMNGVSVSRQSPKQGSGGTRGSIELSCSRAGMNRARRAQGLRRTHVQHQLDYPGDMFFEYTQGLVEQPALWLSKKFQQI